MGVFNLSDLLFRSLLCSVSEETEIIFRFLRGLGLTIHTKNRGKILVLCLPCTKVISIKGCDGMKYIFLSNFNKVHRIKIRFQFNLFYSVCVGFEKNVSIVDCTITICSSLQPQKALKQYRIIFCGMRLFKWKYTKTIIIALPNKNRKYYESKCNHVK